MERVPLATSTFFTPQRYLEEQAQQIESPRGRLLIASCRSGASIAAEVVRRYEERLAEAGTTRGVLFLRGVDSQFSDGETRVRLDTPVSGFDVFLFQALYDPTTDRPVDANYMALFVGATALREWGANHVTALLPYLAYSRQDKPTESAREPTTARLMAELSITAGIDRLVTWHPHLPQIQGFYGNVPVNGLSPLRWLMAEYGRFRDRDDVIAVAPDAGAARLVTRFSRMLNLTTAIASKYRPQVEQVRISEVIGDFRGKRVAIIVDDMISSGGTVYALTKELVEEKGIEEVYLGVSHHLCMPEALDRLNELYEAGYLQELVTTNSVPQTDEALSLPFLSVRDLSDILSWVINRIHYHRSVDELNE